MRGDLRAEEAGVREGLRREHEQLRQKLKGELDKQFGRRGEALGGRGRSEAGHRPEVRSVLGRLFDLAAGRREGPTQAPPGREEPAEGQAAQRREAEERQAAQHEDQVRQLDEIFKSRAADLEQVITEAVSRGSFADERAAASDRGHDSGRAEGGREYE